MSIVTDIPKDYKPVLKTIPESGIKRDLVGYFKGEDYEYATDSYRVHYEHELPAGPLRAYTVDKPTDHTTEYHVDKALLDWLKVAKKFAGRYGPVKFTAVDLMSESQDVGSAHFLRPLTLPDEHRERWGINPQFMLDALQYVSRGKPCSITVTTHQGVVAFHNCTRHAYVMPIRIV